MSFTHLDVTVSTDAVHSILQSQDCRMHQTVQAAIAHVHNVRIIQHHIITIMRRKSVCLSVCRPPLAPFLLHGREPRPLRLSP